MNSISHVKHARESHELNKQPKRRGGPPKYGPKNPRPLPELTEVEKARFWSKVEIRGADDCWLWLASTIPDGYGQLCISRNGKSTMYLAHRISYTLIHGPLPKGKLATHQCDNPACVNPSHIVPATHKQNMRDMRTRQRSPRGENHPDCKLTDLQVAEMRDLHRTGIPTKLLAAAFGISYSHANSVVAFKTRKQPTNPLKRDLSPVESNYP